ncbi:hypothetical protein EHH91_02350 [Salmonella enterica]|uniref:Uncharacterized protein n=2 Tax=Salmonella enterica TaxID=28901 RepID=A0A5Y3WS74_SALER|nr:hypothetical protein [Salmonella enterica]EBP3316085.1 hypothetical protein [Salmonella enterica subsp. enterica]EBQ9200786.1 hypothetical protein [Salmonella enterica subsp. enterica serovar Stanley]ECB9207261.1 hypothetical protein [Salmonella enterica subsp. enterica serovar Hadar]ECF3303907.1 hypothetical protein [Salmonella enterica subsp. enterica serovar Nima]ECT4802609.1 hypothetical protein [Salmonella enterica subsp. enterica serovar Mendoza]EDI0505282.1 hypothetical protein [Sal
MGMIIIPCFIVIAIIAVVIFIMAIKACNMEKREDRQMTLAGIILMGVIAAIPRWFLYEIFSHAP